MGTEKNLRSVSNVGIEHRAARVSLVNGLSTILSIAFQLLSVPICLKYWGQEAYGSWLALFAAYLLLRSLDAGYVAYVGNKLNQLYHHDTTAMRAHMSSAVIGVAVIGSLQLLLAVGALFFDRFAEILGISASATSGLHERLGLLVLMISWVLTGSYSGIIHKLLIPTGLMSEAAWWAMAFQVSQFAAITAAALFRMGALHTSVLFATSQLVIYVASVGYVRRKLPAYYPWWQGGRARTGLKDLSHSMLLTASNLIQQGATSGVVLIVSALAGPTAVPAFATVRTLANLWTTLTNVLTTPLLPDVVRFHATVDGHKLLAVNQAYWVLVGSIVNWGVLVSYPLLGALYAFWTGHALTLHKALVCLLLGSVVVSGAGGLMAMYLNGINSLRIVLAMSSIRGMVALGGGALLYSYFGLAAFGVSILVGEIIVLAVLARNFFQSPIFESQVKNPLRAGLPALLSAGSVCAFLVADGFGLLTITLTWPLAIVLLLISTTWGWLELADDLKKRIAAVNPFNRKNKNDKLL